MKLTQLAILALIGVTLVAAPTFAADGEMAVVHRNATGLVVDSLVQHGGATLTVTGPGGFAVTKSFKAGEDPIFSIFDGTGAPLADGAYTFEVSYNLKLDGAARQALARARANGETPQVERFEPVSGYFRIADGVLVSDAEESGERLTSAAQPAAAGALEGTSAADQVISDDLIVDGSICAGFDCVNGESFGFDTLRLKENNLRIKAQDTSSTASFPTRDWQITFNETTNGGAEKFSIDDIDGGRTPFTIIAGAPSNSLFVNSSGRLGIGTSSPVVNVHVKTGNTPTLRLEQDGTSGFTPQTWDVAGNEANFFIRDATNGSTLPLRIFPSAPSNALTIEGSTGDIGLGTTSPTEALHITDSSSTANARVLIENTGATTNNTNLMLQMRNNGSIQVNMTDTQTGTDETWQINASASFLRIRKAGNATGNEFELNSVGNLTLTGSITTAAPNTCSVGCDLVFSPDYALPSIEEHAAEMFENSHLPAVGPTPENGPFNLNEKVGGMLNELEKAHIYIAQLNERLATRDEQIEALQTAVEELKQLLK